MALLFGHLALLSGGEGTLDASFTVTEPASLSPSRSLAERTIGQRILNLRNKVAEGKSVVGIDRVQTLCLALLFGSVVMVFGCMFQPPQGGGGAQPNMRMPPRWEPAMETTLPFRTWMQDLMLWTIVTDLTPPQQTAAIISQLGGPARELARTLTPDEVYNGGMVNGVRVDPVSFLLHGLSHRFAPLDEENRLRAVQDLLSFTRRQHETVDALVSRFDITRQLARREGGGALPMETAALILLRSCGVSSDQFQALTQPFGLRLPSTEPEFQQMCHHLRRMAHIVERHPNNIASGLRGSSQAHYSQAFMAEADTGSSHSAENWAPYGAGSEAPASFGMQDPASVDWAFPTQAAPADASGTDSETSSDRDEPLPVEDLQGMSAAQADEYLFGQYQQAKKRWRRYTGKPVRSLRRVLKRKGKGKGKRNSYLNIDSLLQQSAYFKGKGKGGNTSGKGFGRKQNPCGRDGEPLKCSICGSSYHLRARCPRRDASSGSGAQASSQPQRAAPSFTVEPASGPGMHFATFDSESSWVPVSPRSVTSSRVDAHRPEQQLSAPSQPQAQPQPQPGHAPTEEHQLSPDPWVTNADPWMMWLNEGHAETAAASARQQYPQTARGTRWYLPGLGALASASSFSETVGLNSMPSNPVGVGFSPTPSGFSSSHSTHVGIGFSPDPVSSGAAPLFAPSTEPPPLPEAFTAIGQVQEAVRMQGDARPRSSSHRADRGPQALPSVFASHSGMASASAPVPDVSALPGVGIFGQVQLLRQHVQAQGQAPGLAPVPEQPISSSPARPFHGHVSACSICLSEFIPGDQVCRMSCGHVFHCLCIGELATMGTATFADSGEMCVECPNCRSMVSTQRAWRYPTLPQAEESPADPAGTEQPRAVSPADDQEGAMSEAPSPRGTEVSTPDAQPEVEEFMSPMEMYPWWPVPEPVPAASQAQSQEGPTTASSYHSNGRVGLLVDPGSYGNLVGSEWLTEASKGLSQVPQLTARQTPLHVGGVGKGAQMCHDDCKVPISLTRHDGSVAGGTFTSPVVANSGCPALLGLKALADNRAILDLGKRQLHFLGEGEPTLVLPSGSETFQLESALSGHLLLPCTSHAQSGETVHHLFADPPEVSTEGYPNTTLCEASLESEERACEAATDFESASQLLCELSKGWKKGRSGDGTARFDDQGGLSFCVGAYTHGGVQGLTKLTASRPKLTKMLTAMIAQKAPDHKYTSIMVLVDALAPMRTDKFNRGDSLLLPVCTPKHGGGLWTELLPGDKVTGTVEVRHGPNGPIAGQNHHLTAGEPLVFNPKARHATVPWKSGTRIALAAYTTGGVQKLTEAHLTSLRELGFLNATALVGVSCDSLQGQVGSARPEVEGEPRSPLPSAPPAPSVPFKAGNTHAGSAKGQARHADRSVSSHHAMSSAADSPMPPKRNTKPSHMGILRKVLLITIFHSTMSAFLDSQWEVFRLRPLEILRNGFDDALTRLKAKEFGAVWVDIADAKQFASGDRISQVCGRLAVVNTWAERLNVPIVYSASRHSACKHPAFEQLLHKTHMTVSHHAWCRVGAKLTAEVSSAQHKVFSSIRLPSSPCECGPSIKHVFDLCDRSPGSAKFRAQAEQKVICSIIATLSRALSAPSESLRPSDPVCSFPSTAASADNYVCSECGLVQQGPSCSFCLDPCLPSGSSLPQPYAVQAEHPANVLPGSPAAPPPAEQTMLSSSHPTHAKLLQKQRQQQAKASGAPAPVPKKKPKKVEQHFDDCGEDLSSLNFPVAECWLSDSSVSESELAEDAAASGVSPQLNAFVNRPVCGSSDTSEPALSPQTFLAVDVDEMTSILASPAYASWGVEIVELCGGEGLTSRLCVRRQLRAGHNFELLTGADLTDSATQTKVLGYLSVAKPLVVVMAPICTPYGPLGSRNRVLHPEAWTRSIEVAEPVAAFCGKVAQLQMKSQRFYLTEQPYPSNLYCVQPWPSIRTHASCYRIVFHQCMLGQMVDNQLVKKPTELVANSKTLLQPFANRQCNGAHVHLQLLGGRAHQARKWPRAMCELIVFGIERLVRELGKAQHFAALEPSYPSAAVGTGDSGSVPVEEPWRNCKGCLWRLAKYDPLHSRIRGQCKHPDEAPHTFECPACVARKPRSDEAHTFGPDCKHAHTSQRASARQRRPFGRVPAKAEPTSGLKADGLGRAAEQQAEDALAPRANAPSSSWRDPQPPDEDEAGRPAASPAGEPASSGRGPDTVQRHRRSWQEAEAQSPVPSDWSTFDIQSTLRALRGGSEADHRRLLRKLHVRWWHASTERLTSILRTAGVGREETPVAYANIGPGHLPKSKPAPAWSLAST